MIKIKACNEEGIAGATGWGFVEKVLGDLEPSYNWARTPWRREFDMLRRHGFQLVLLTDDGDEQRTLNTGQELEAAMINIQSLGLVCQSDHEEMLLRLKYL